MTDHCQSYPKPFVVVVAANEGSSLEAFACRAAVVVSQKGWAPGGLHAFHHLCRRLPQSSALLPAQMLLAAPPLSSRTQGAGSLVRTKKQGMPAKSAFSKKGFELPMRNFGP